MKNMGGIKIIMIAALALMILSGTCAAVSLSNSGGGTWKYQREISIKENSGTALMDYQVLIELKGADFPGEVKNGGADIRFTDSSGNELSYWIESWDYAGKNAKVWVKISNIPAGSITVIRIYYGNPNAGIISNGENVFDFFDDFNADMLDTVKWIEKGSGSIDISNSILHSIGAKTIYGKADINNIFNKYIEVRGKFKGILHTDVEVGFGYISGLGSMELWRGDRIGEWITAMGYDSKTITIANGSGGEDCIQENAGELWDYSNYYNYRIKFENNHVRLWKEDTLIHDISATCKQTSSDLPVLIVFDHYSTSPNDEYIDWVRIRKYASTEPTITLSPPKSSSLSITKSASPYSLRQFQETTIKVLIENSGTSEVKAIEIIDSIHPSFDLTGGDFPNPKKFDSIRAGESRELQYTIRSKESGAFTLDPATVTYADSEGNIQEVKSEPVSIKVVPSSESGGGAPYGQYSKSASVSLHGEKTDVVMGEDILLRLSAVNLITKPKMHVQVIIIPPSGMSVTSSEFSKSAAGQFTANYELEPGDGKDIEVRIRSNQVGDFNVNGRIIYYFGDDKEKAEDQTLNLPIKVRKELASTPVQNPAATSSQKSTPGFAGKLAIIVTSFMALFIRKR